MMYSMMWFRSRIVSEIHRQRSTIPAHDVHDRSRGQVCRFRVDRTPYKGVASGTVHSMPSGDFPIALEGSYCDDMRLLEYTADQSMAFEENGADHL